MFLSESESTSGKKIGSFESFRITRHNAGFLGLGIEIQPETVTVYYDEARGFSSDSEPKGRPVVRSVGSLKRQVQEGIENNQKGNLEMRNKIRNLGRL